MSDQKHTPEPWEVRKHAGTNLFGCLGQNNDWFVFENALEKDAARIVACVNACAGMEDPQAEIAKLKADNARMLNVIRVMQEATANDPTWINTNRVLSSILKDCIHA